MEPMPYERRRRRGLGWLWPLLALLLLLALIVLLVRACGDDDDGTTAGGGAATAAETTGGGGDGGTVQFDELLGASGGSLAEWEGRDVDVADAEVLAVVTDAGFWIGTGNGQRVFVEIEDETGLDELGLEDGDTVTFVGKVERNVEAETYGLRGEDATLFREQGAHIRAQAEDVETA